MDLTQLSCEDFLSRLASKAPAPGGGGAAALVGAAGVALGAGVDAGSPGVTLGAFIRNAVELQTGSRLRLWSFKKELERAMELLDMDPSYAERDLNVGFSGGEKKKAEILQLLMLKPALAILDETDSGLDVDAVRTVSAGIRKYQEDCKGSLLIITHSTKILESLHVDATHVMVEGSIIKNGGASLVNEINESGFAEYEQR